MGTKLFKTLRGQEEHILNSKMKFLDFFKVSLLLELSLELKGSALSSLVVTSHL